jgi:hypothetical protein
MNRKNLICQKSACSNEPYLGGLCQVHHKEDQSRKQLRDDALTALHSGIVDGNPPRDPDLCSELDRLRVYWDRACLVLQTQHGTDLMPLDEAEFATDWCITLAQRIVEAQRKLTTGDALPMPLTLTRKWVWERLRNLDAGLRSNGTRRE